MIIEDYGGLFARGSNFLVELLIGIKFSLHINNMKMNRQDLADLEKGIGLNHVVYADLN